MTLSVNYDLVAPAYDERYRRNRFEGVETALSYFIGKPETVDVAEVGCGTGHWLARLCGKGRKVAGLDRSAEMLQRARTVAPDALLVRGRAEQLPWATGTFDRIFCINAMHHFDGAQAFMLEARRVLRPGGAFMTIGLDPHARVDEWWIYDYFPGALDADRARYVSTALIREWLAAAGFTESATEVAQHIAVTVPFAIASESGLLDRRSTSQLLVISDGEYEAGLQRLRAAQPTLRADLRLYATVGWLPSTLRRGT